MEFGAKTHGFGKQEGNYFIAVTNFLRELDLFDGFGYDGFGIEAESGSIVRAFFENTKLYLRKQTLTCKVVISVSQLRNHANQLII